MKKVILVFALALIMIFGGLNAFAMVNSNLDGALAGSAVIEEPITTNGEPWPSPNVE